MLERNDERFTAHPHREAFNNGEGQRQADRNRAAFASRARNLHCPAQNVDVAPDHIETHPTARKVGYRFRGGESRLEHQAINILVAKLI